ncbi:MAG: PA2169 family four-helix-bundle protein [Planctomycetota bacterium]
MNTRIPETAQDMTQETVEGLQDLSYALRDSISYHREAIEAVDDDYVKSAFLEIATEREKIVETIGGFVTLAEETPVKDGTWMGSLRSIWTSFRAALNAGDPTVVLIEAERAEDVIVHKFKDVLPMIAGNPINDHLLKFFETVKSGHDRVLALRNTYQNA